MSILIFLPMALLAGLLERPGKPKPYRGHYSRRPTKFDI